jgi:dynein intermediate chain 2, axonemal
MLERESKRERILEARLREIRLKMRQAEEGSPTHSIGEPDPATGDRDLHEASADYFAQVKKEIASL